MPTPEKILNGLSLAANSYTLLSIFWHIIVLLFLILLISGKRPSNKLVTIGSILTMLSVALVAIMVSNPFNAVMFLLASLLFAYITWRLPQTAVSISWDFYSVTGIIMIAFGLVYPHFLEDADFFNYLYASPLGLIPCPTLSLVVGFTLLFHGLYFKKWMLSLALVGLFYGIFGVFRLKVYLDLVLIAGSLSLVVLSFMIKNTENILKTK